MRIELTPNAVTVLERRYLKKAEGQVIESPEDMFRRVAANIADVEASVYGKSAGEVSALRDRFLDMMVSLEFLPNSPTLMNAGRELQQLAACFVLPVDDSLEGIFESVKHAALIHQSGGGTGFSFSRLRPKNDVVRTTGGVASGPVSFIEVFDSATNSVKQGGMRRGANMGILRCDHPDIVEFISCKRESARINNFNLSVAVTDKFVEALKKGGEYDLINPRTGKATGQVKARHIFDLIVDSAWLSGEPGIVFIDRVNAHNPTPLAGEIESTNPCGEQPLLPFESCCLGSINLARMVTTPNGKPVVDYDRLARVVHLGVHFLDNVIDANRYPLPQIEAASKANRKIGLGIMGWADLLIELNMPYDSREALEFAGRLMRFIHTEGLKASETLAGERGVFPNFAGSVFDTPDGPRIRNATITTIAPTGTLSIIAGTSSGIEPIFSIAFVRNVLDNDRLVEVNPLFERFARSMGFCSRELMEQIAEKGSVRDIEQIPEHVRRIFVTAHEMTPEVHVRMQSAFQTSGVDNAVSKTVNMPGLATKDDVAGVFLLAYELGCKGITVYREGSRDKEVLTKGTAAGETKGGTPAVKEGGSKRPAPGPEQSKVPGNGIVPRKRPVVTLGRTERLKTGCGNLYVTINEDEHGMCEVFTAIGKQGGCAGAFSEATARLVSLALRTGVKPGALFKELRGIRCPSPAWQGNGMILSCPDAMAIAMERYLSAKQAGDAPVLDSSVLDRNGNAMGACPECGGHVKHADGCIVCLFCGYSKCS